MGYDVCFYSTGESAQTPVVNISYSYNTFYKAFDLPRCHGKTGEMLIKPLEEGMAELERMYHNLNLTKNLLNATPGNYHQYLKLLHSYAKAHPTWVLSVD